MPDQEKTFIIDACLPPHYSALHAYCGVPLLSFVTLRGVQPSFCGSPVLRVSGTSGDHTIVDREIALPSLSAHSGLAQEETVVPLDLTAYKVFPEKTFWKTCRSRLTAPIRVSVTWGDFAASTTVNVRFLPQDAFSPELSPELLACHVRPAHPALEAICDEANSLLWELYGTAPNERRTSPARCADALFRAILRRELSYSAALTEVFIQEGNFRDFGAFLNGNVHSVSRSEAALLYASCAERLGLFCSIVCLRVGAGAIHVMLGVRVDGGYSQNALSESVSTLREWIADGKLLVFDVESLLRCENADIRKSASESASLIFKSSTAVSFILDVAGARAVGVRSLSPYGAALPSSGYEGLKKTVETIVKNEQRGTLSGFSPYRAPVCGLAAKSGELKLGTTYSLLPCDDELFAQFPDALSLLTAFEGRFSRFASRTLGEQATYEEKRRRFEEKRTSGLKKGALRLYPSAYVLSCEKTDTLSLREAYYRALDALRREMRQDDTSSGDRRLYAAVGAVSFEEDGKTVCAPCLFVPCELHGKPEEPLLLYGSDKPVYNHTLYKRLVSLIPDGEGRAQSGLSLRSFAALCDASGGKASFFGDVFLSAFDLSYTHMCACLERAAGSPFETYLESGKYIPSGVQGGGFASSAMPFSLTSEQKNAVVGAQTDSAVLFGLPRTGENGVCAGAIARAALSGEHVLVSSPYTESLHSLMRTVDEADVQGLCLPLTDKDGMKQRILRDLSLAVKEPENAELADPSDELSAAASFLDAYTKELYIPRECGYSLCDCVREYYEAGSPAGSAVLPVDFKDAGRPVQKADADALFALCKDLRTAAETLSDALGKQTIAAVGFSHLHTQTPPPAPIRKTLSDAAQKLRLLRDHSLLLREKMGIAPTDLMTVRGLLAFGDFLTRLLHYGEKRLPESLSDKNISDSLKLLNEACDLLEKRENAQAVLKTVSVDLSREPYDAVCERWTSVKKNLFARGGVLRELRRLLPEGEKKSGAEAASLLQAFFDRKTVDEALSGMQAAAVDTLGVLWQGCATDRAKLCELRGLLDGAQKDLKELFQRQPERADSLVGLLDAALEAVHGAENGRESLVLSVSDFSALSADGFSKGLLCDISRAFGCDFDELDFPGGVLEEDGLCATLRCWHEHFGAAGALCAFNTAVKRASDAGLSAFADAAKNTLDFERLSVTFRQSVFSSLVKLSTQGKAYFLPEPYRAMRENYGELYAAERRFAAANLSKQRRASIARFLSSAEGKTALLDLKQDLDAPSVSPVRLYERNAQILNVMYTAFLLPLYDALRLSVLPASLILLDCDRTDAAAGVALSAGFDRCLFVTRPCAKNGSLVSALPAQLPVFRLTRREPETNGYAAAFLSEEFPDLLKDFAVPASPDAVRFIHVPTGLYDRASRTNAIEAVAAAENAWELGEQYGFDSVGVLVSTLPQRREVEQALILLSRKYSRPEGLSIPVRAIGACGDIRRDHLVLSVTFGKNMYAMTRTFGDADSVFDRPAGGSAYLSSLLYAGKTLRVVSSVQPEEIVPDSVSPGAHTIRCLLTFAKYRTPQDTSAYASPRWERLVDRVLPCGVCHAPLTAVLHAREGRAAVFDGDRTKDTFDRVLLTDTILANGGYDVNVVTLSDLIP